VGGLPGATQKGAGIPRNRVLGRKTRGKAEDSAIKHLTKTQAMITKLLKYKREAAPSESRPHRNLVGKQVRRQNWLVSALNHNRAARSNGAQVGSRKMGYGGAHGGSTRRGREADLQVSGI